MNQISLLIMNILIAQIFFLQQVTAHGGGGGLSSPQALSDPTKFSRKDTSNTPAVLVQADLKAFGGGLAKIPEDVVIISCKLNKMARCRGITVLLQNTSGKDIVRTNSGLDGVLGFQGLKPNYKYQVKIVSERYEGKVSVATGKLWVLDGRIKGSSDILATGGALFSLKPSNDKRQNSN